ncbi:carbohydrate-binding protein [Chryseolinea sp. T2]|uniref:carbohydrate-binding protein n=1 Tax=Chryseolinea sp. T2 TaxID=3129255 RepID=UPI0030782532
MKSNMMAIRCALIMCSLAACQGNRNHYEGKPFSDAQNKAAQTIPGRLQFELYDLGGEGVAFHDNDSTNSGSGKLNPADGNYLNEFRLHEPVDISYTKFRDPLIDNSPFNFVEPEPDQLYVGWTAPGEWIKYTVDVKESGKYRLGLMYTANQDGQIALSVNDVDVTGPIDVPSTYVDKDTIAWRQWHHWNYLDQLPFVQLEKGTQVLTLHTIAVGQMNYEHLDFELIK